jgi:F0F1-type ATP synthase assembly protein I
MELAGFGVQFVASVLLFLYAGRWLDARLHTAPLCLILGAFLGAAAAFYSLIRKLTGKGRGGGR